MNRPAQLYHPSAQSYDGTDKPLEYPDGFVTKKLQPNGKIHLGGDIYYIVEAFVGLNVGLKILQSAHPEVFFANVRLGKLINNSKDPFWP